MTHRSLAHRRTRFALFLAGTLCFCLCDASVWAAENRASDTERAEAKVIEAKAFFKSALYPRAAESYLQAYAISRKPATLFNAARAYEEAKLLAESIALFEQYQQLADAPPDGRHDAGERIAHDRAQLAVAATTAKPTETAPAPEAKPTDMKAAEPKPEVAVTVDKPAVEPDQPSAQPTRKSNWLDWALFAGGDTLVLLGLLGYVGAVNTVNQANAMDFSALGAEANYRSQVTQARTARAGSIVLALVGAGAAGWGAWRLWGPGSDKPAEAEVKSTGWLVPAIAPHAVGVAWGGRF